MSCMMNPEVCWVVNIRTIWTYLLRKHAWNVTRANRELALYRGRIGTSEADYNYWVALHPEMGEPLTVIAAEGSEIAGSDGVSPGDLTFLWADAIADALDGGYAR